jgi:hypothetical protein
MLKDKTNLTFIILNGVSFLLSVLSMIIGSPFVGWICFVGIGLSIYPFMSSIKPAIKTKDKNQIFIAAISGFCIILGFIALFMYAGAIKAFISGLI